MRDLYCGGRVEGLCLLINYGLCKQYFLATIKSRAEEIWQSENIVIFNYGWGNIRVGKMKPGGTSDYRYLGWEE